MKTKKDLHSLNVVFQQVKAFLALRLAGPDLVFLGGSGFDKEYASPVENKLKFNLNWLQENLLFVIYIFKETSFLNNFGNIKQFLFAIRNLVGCIDKTKHYN